MKTKVCTKCKIEKEITEFYKKPKQIYGVNPRCKVCIREDAKEYRDNNKESIRTRDKKYREENKERIAARQKKFREENKERISEQRKKYREENKERISEQQKEWYKKPENKAKVKAYQQKNKKKIRAWDAKYRKERMQNEPVYRMIRNYRSATSSYYTGHRKAYSTMELLGCTREELQRHLEDQFQPGMTLENYGKWHIDHIRPIASFDLSDPEQQKQCWHYTNLQPLWASDNCSKGARYEQ